MPESGPRTIEQLVTKYPLLRGLRKTIYITEGNCQIWSYWISRLGEPTVREICESVTPTHLNGLLNFEEVHPALQAWVARRS